MKSTRNYSLVAAFAVFIGLLFCGGPGFTATYESYKGDIIVTMDFITLVNAGGIGIFFVMFAIAIGCLVMLCVIAFTDFDQRYLLLVAGILLSLNVVLSLASSVAVTNHYEAAGLYDDYKFAMGWGTIMFMIFNGGGAVMSFIGFATYDFYFNNLGIGSSVPRYNVQTNKPETEVHVDESVNASVKKTPKKEAPDEIDELLKNGIITKEQYDNLKKGK